MSETDAYAVSGAGTADRLWITTTVRRGESTSLESSTFELDESNHWLPIGSPVPGVSSDHAIFSAAYQGAPCVAHGTTDEPALRCHQDGQWKYLSSHPGFAPVAFIVGMKAWGNRLCVLAQNRTYTSVSLMCHNGESWNRVGAKLNARHSIATLGTGSRGRLFVELSSQQGRKERHIYAISPSGRTQKIRRLTPRGFGPVLSGPIEDRNTIMTAVVNTRHNPWSFGIYRFTDRWRAPRRPLNRGSGNAQGLIAITSRGPRAIWQEHKPLKAGGFDARVYVAEISRATGAATARRRLWAGRSIGPGEANIVEGRGHAWALYLRGSGASLTPSIESID